MIINNVNMVLAQEIIHGSLEVRNGVIHHISDRPSRHPAALMVNRPGSCRGLSNFIRIILISASPRAPALTGPLKRRCAITMR